MGKKYHCANLMMGATCQRGHDSHVSPDGQEFVLFSAAQVLPVFVVVFSGATANYYNYDWKKYADASEQAVGNGAIDYGDPMDLEEEPPPPVSSYKPLVSYPDPGYYHAKYWWDKLKKKW